jgi:hypothetical protein
MTDGLWTLLGALVAPLLDPRQRLYIPYLCVGAAFGCVWLVVHRVTNPSAKPIWHTILTDR